MDQPPAWECPTPAVLCPEPWPGPLSHTHSLHKVQNIYFKNLNTTKHPVRALGRQELGPRGPRTGPGGLQKALEGGGGLLWVSPSCVRCQSSSPERVGLEVPCSCGRLPSRDGEREAGSEMSHVSVRRPGRGSCLPQDTWCMWPLLSAQPAVLCGQRSPPARDP